MFRLSLTTITLLLITLFASDSWAHKFDPERFIVIDSSKDNLEVLITFREPPGKRLDYLLGIYDRDKNGIFSKQESIAVSPALKKIALSGLNISENMKVEKTRVKYKKRDGISIALLYQLPKKVNTLTFTFGDNETQILTSVHFIGDALSLVNGNGPTKGTTILSAGSFGLVRKK